jgi:hypothetical protein
MTTSRRFEIVCGLASCLLGFLALGIDFFAPLETSSTIVGNGVTVTSTTSYAQANGGVTFYFVLIGIPLVVVALSAVWHSLSFSVVARILLWIATIVLTALMILAMLSIGPTLLPSVALAWVAASLALVNRRTVAEM